MEGARKGPGKTLWTLSRRKSELSQKEYEPSIFSSNCCPTIFSSIRFLSWLAKHLRDVLSHFVVTDSQQCTAICNSILTQKPKTNLCRGTDEYTCHVQIHSKTQRQCKCTRSHQQMQVYGKTQRNNLKYLHICKYIETQTCKS